VGTILTGGTDANAGSRAFVIHPMQSLENTRVTKKRDASNAINKNAWESVGGVCLKRRVAANRKDAGLERRK
jgi:hypothetical protein